MLYQKRWVQAWLGWGVLWFLAGIALAPSSKVYQQGLILFLWLPVLALAWSARGVFAEAWRRQPALWSAVALFFVWGVLSLAWSSTEEGAREAKRLVYILLFLMAFPLLAQLGVSRIRLALGVAGGLLALGALLSILYFYVRLANPWMARLEGIGGLSHPILGAYVIGMAVLWMLYEVPRQRTLQLGWILALACLGAFVALSQSRGAGVALVIAVLMAPLWFRDRHSKVFALLALAATAFAFSVFHGVIMIRGASYRPEIFASSVQMIAEHPWGGLGLGAFYRVEAVGIQFDHTHNMFTHVAVELGLPGMLLWTAIWLFALGEILRARNTHFGKVLLGLWVFATLAMQFDAANLTGTPRAEWFVSWLPVGLAMTLPWLGGEAKACGKISGST